MSLGSWNGVRDDGGRVPAQLDVRHRDDTPPGGPHRPMREPLPRRRDRIVSPAGCNCRSARRASPNPAAPEEDDMDMGRSIRRYAELEEAL